MFIVDFSLFVHTGVFMLRESASEVTYPNNSAVLLEDINSEMPLTCTTTHASCCTGGHDTQGRFFYPDGSPVQTQSQAASSSQSFYMTQNEGSIGLVRQDGDPPPLGSYRCEVPDGGGNSQKLYIRIGETIYSVCMYESTCVCVCEFECVCACAHQWFIFLQVHSPGIPVHPHHV
jgi:hypothetical protein